jgi:hypothetical protein
MSCHTERTFRLVIKPADLDWSMVLGGFLETKLKVKTPTLPRTGEEWGTPRARKREAKSNANKEGQTLARARSGIRPLRPPFPKTGKSGAPEIDNSVEPLNHESGLFVAEGDHGIYVHAAAGGEIAG